MGKVPTFLMCPTTSMKVKLFNKIIKNADLMWQDGLKTFLSFIFLLLQKEPYKGSSSILHDCISFSLVVNWAIIFSQILVEIFKKNYPPEAQNI